MKQMIRKTINHIPMLLILSIALWQSSCKKDNSGAAPVITNIRAYNPSPNDSILSFITPGNWIVIQGSNLASTKSILFDGFPIALTDLHNALFSDNNIVVPVPSNIPFGTVTDAQLNTVTITNSVGSTTFKFPIAFPKIAIGGVSNEFALPGDSLMIYGAGMFRVSKVIFPGQLEVTSFSSVPTGQYITVKVPSNLTEAGPIQVISDYGTATSKFNIEDTTGMKCNFDDFNNQNAWDNMVSSDPNVYPGSRGSYGVFQFADCPAGDWGDWQTGRGIRTTEVQWVPDANLTDSTSKWAIKFEMYVKNPWSAGCIFIQDGKWGSTFRFEPWKIVPSGIYTTLGWTTFTVPLSSILTKVNGVDGTGVPYATVANLLANDTNGKMATLYFGFDNPLVDVQNFSAGIDNIRVVKIK